VLLRCMEKLTKRIRHWLFSSRKDDFFWQPQWSAHLLEYVAFYRWLNDEDRQRFERRCFAFLRTTRIEASGAVDISDDDRLLVAASSVIPVWGFPDWPYLSVKAVVLFPGLFNRDFECGQPDSTIAGMVGSGPMAGKMALSKPELHYGFRNSHDKKNVGVHEFAHILDMVDGRCDGDPKITESGRCSQQWFAFIQHKIGQIEKRKSNIDAYGATNAQEFFAVSSEYFFERPLMLKQKHPALYEYLSDFYRQNLADIEREQRSFNRKRG